MMHIATRGKRVQPLVSIVVLVYRIEQYLSQCVESLLNQSYQHIEIILVNDGSDDRSPQLCDQFAMLDSRVRVLHQPNRGLVLARRAGLNAARGDYVAFVDGDDWVDTVMVEQLLGHALDSSADVVIAGHKEVLGDSIVEDARCRISAGCYTRDVLQSSVFPRMLCYDGFAEFGVFSYFWDKLFRTDLIRRHQRLVDHDIFMGDDAACVYPCLLDSNVVKIVDESLYYYRQRVSSSVKIEQDKVRDRQRLRTLYRCMERRFRVMGYESLLAVQLKQFVCSLLLVRGLCGNVDGGRRSEIPGFVDVPAASRVAIYGAGTFGQHLCRRLRDDATCAMTSWSDPNWSVYQRLGVPVVSPEELAADGHDLCIVAFASASVAASASAVLRGVGVRADRLRSLWVPAEYCDRVIEGLVSDQGAPINEC